MDEHDDGGRQNPEKPKWSVAKARRQFTELIRSTAREPQPIYNRQRLVGVVVDAVTFEEFLRWKEEQAGRSIATALDELRNICQAEGYRLELPDRVDRDNPFDRAPE